MFVDGQDTVIPFLNIYDKGYRAKMAAWQNGRQLVLQPDFKKSDKKFNRSQTILSASVATDHGRNERVVNVSKRAGLISRGFQPNADPIRFNNGQHGHFSSISYSSPCWKINNYQFLLIKTTNA